MTAPAVVSPLLGVLVKRVRVTEQLRWAPVDETRGAIMLRTSPHLVHGAFAGVLHRESWWRAHPHQYSALVVALGLLENELVRAAHTGDFSHLRTTADRCRYCPIVLPAIAERGKGCPT